MPMGVTEIVATSMDVVANLVQETLKQKSILLPTVTDYSRFAVKGSKQVDVPRRDQLAAGDKSENTDLTLDQLTFSVDSIVLNKHKAIAVELEDIARIQATPDIEAEIVQEMALELALQLDKDFITQISAVSAAAPDHIIDYANSPTDTIQQTDILEARKLLNDQIVPQTDRFLLIGPDQEKQMLLLSDFVRVNAYGPGAGLSGGLREAELGRIYGFTVMMHTSVAADTVFFYHKSHVGYATQLNVRFDRDRNVLNVADTFVMSWLYGTIVLDSGKRGVELNTSGA